MKTGESQEGKYYFKRGKADRNNISKSIYIHSLVCYTEQVNTNRIVLFWLSGNSGVSPYFTVIAAH